MLIQITRITETKLRICVQSDARHQFLWTKTTTEHKRQINVVISSVIHDVTARSSPSSSSSSVVYAQSVQCCPLPSYYHYYYLGCCSWQWCRPSQTAVHRRTTGLRQLAVTVTAWSFSFTSVHTITDPLHDWQLACIRRRLSDTAVSASEIQNPTKIQFRDKTSQVFWCHLPRDVTPPRPQCNGVARSFLWAPVPPHQNPT